MHERRAVRRGTGRRTRLQHALPAGRTHGCRLLPDPWSQCGACGPMLLHGSPRARCACRCTQAAGGPPAHPQRGQEAPQQARPRCRQAADGPLADQWQEAPGAGQAAPGAAGRRQTGRRRRARRRAARAAAARPAPRAAAPAAPRAASAAPAARPAARARPPTGARPGAGAARLRARARAQPRPRRAAWDARSKLGGAAAAT